MASPSISTTTIARAAQLVGFAVVAVALAIVAWRGTSLNLPDVGQFAGIIGSGFLGGIINPLIKKLTGVTTATVTTTTTAAQVEQTVEAAGDDAAKALGSKTDLMWEAAVVIGAIAIVVSALALAIDGERHMNAAAALTALATAFGALFVDTSRVTHGLGTVITSAGS